MKNIAMSYSTIFKSLTIVLHLHRVYLLKLKKKENAYL